MKHILPSTRIGFIQGRLCDMVEGKIQAFPWDDWRDEFPVAQRLGLGLMEWTLDHDLLYENPLLTAKGQQEIRALCAAHAMAIPNLTGDLFMQAPFYKTTGTLKDSLIANMMAVFKACAAVGIQYVVIPLVDGGRLENHEQEDVLVHELEKALPFLKAHTMGVLFESDYSPQKYYRFINRLNRTHFGINLDIGNSAALGFSYKEELSLYGDRILNVHIKDRLANGGTTVPLGTGAADIPGTIAALESEGYAGNYILQTARASNGDHAEIIAQYRAMMLRWLSE